MTWFVITAVLLIFTQDTTMTQRQLLGLLGSMVLFVGVFMPIVSIPILGAQNYFQNGQGVGIIILILAGISALLCFGKNFKGLFATGLISLAVLAFTFLRFLSKMSEAKAEMQKQIGDNPFKGLGEMAMQSVQLQWGWAVMVVGALLLIGVALMRSDQITESDGDQDEGVYSCEHEGQTGNFCTRCGASLG